MVDTISSELEELNKFLFKELFVKKEQDPTDRLLRLKFYFNQND